MNEPRCDDANRGLAGLIDADSLIHLGLAILALLTCLRLFGEPPSRMPPPDDVYFETGAPGMEE